MCGCWFASPPRQAAGCALEVPCFLDRWDGRLCGVVGKDREFAPLPGRGRKKGLTASTSHSGGGGEAKSGRTASRAPWLTWPPARLRRWAEPLAGIPAAAPPQARMRPPPLSAGGCKRPSPPVSITPPGAARYMLPQWFLGSEARVSLPGGLCSAGRAEGSTLGSLLPWRSPRRTGPPLHATVPAWWRLM